VISTGTAGAQVGPAEIDLAKSVSQTAAAPNEDFIFFLSYSCSSLTVPCENATITDTLPPQVSRAAADVQFGGNFADVEYNPATGTALFTLFTPLPAGTTAQVSITVRFPSGTAPGTTATNQATMTAANAAPAQSNQVTVTALAASAWTVTKGRVTAAAQLDTPFTYRVAITLAAGGTQNVDNARLVDTLPPGAQFVSATQGGAFDAGTNTVTWQVGTLVPNANNAVTYSREVTVIFPSSLFQAGDTPVNNVEALGAPAGEPDQSLGQAQFPVTLRAAGDITAASKRDTLGSLGPGQSDVYTITGTNPNAGPLDEFTITENLPVELSMVQDGSPNLTGTGTAPQISWRPLGGTLQAIGTSPSGGGWGATIPANADEIVLGYGTVPASFAATAQLRAGIPANGIGRGGVPIAPGATIRNCVTVAGSSGGAAAIPRSSCTDQTVVPLSVQFSKTRTSSPVVPPSGDVTWDIGVGVDATSASDLVNPVVTDCLPPDIDLVDPTDPLSAVNGASAGLSPAPVLARTAGAAAPTRCCSPGAGQRRSPWPGVRAEPSPSTRGSPTRPPLPPSRTWQPWPPATWPPLSCGQPT
jgi:hypothetical protein